jgi:hypothetical protein
LLEHIEGERHFSVWHSVVRLRVGKSHTPEVFLHVETENDRRALEGQDASGHIREPTEDKAVQ